MTDWKAGREAQSSAFFRTPGMLWLNSGATPERPPMSFGVSSLNCRVGARTDRLLWGKARSIPFSCVRRGRANGTSTFAWQPPTRLLDGSAPTGPLAYEVLRATAADAPLAPVARTPAGALALTDRELENDRTYWYAVRAVRTEEGTTAYGAPSGRVTVTPRDMTPPSSPTSLVAIPSEGIVRLAWAASPESDVSGYIVYRADAGGAFVRVGSTQTPTTTFVDRDVPRGTYRYAVTAEDSGAIRNESARSNEVTVTVP